MNEMDLLKVAFLKQFNLGPVTHRNDSYTISEDHITTTLPRQYSDLFEKNNSIVTGYENFCIKKGTVKLFPIKDFDFIGKHVVCQKCCQTFASKMSYRAHVGTSICIRTYNGPNLVYLNYKNRNSRRFRKKNKKLIEDLPHYLKKNLLNPEMLNTLQTRNNCYSDVVHQRNKIKEKQRSGSDDSSIKKPRGRPKKTIEVKPKKRGRPKKLNSGTVNNLGENDNNSFNNLESNETMSKKSSLVNICSADDAYNNNINESGKLKLMYTRIKNMVEKCCELLNSEWPKDISKHQSLIKQNDHLQCNTEEKLSGSSIGDKHLSLYITSLNIDLKNLSKRFQRINDKCPYKKDVDLMLLKLKKKHDEYLQKKTDMNNELTAGMGKENMHCTIEIDHETDNTDINTETYSDHKINKVETSIKLWMKQSEGVLSSREECRNENNFCDEVTTNSGTFSSPYNSETSDDITSSMNSHSNSIDRLNCGICDTNFASIAEWKMHYSEHTAKKSNNFLCKVCGHRFKVYKNYAKHVHLHRITDQSEQEQKIIDDKKYSKRLICESCGRHYNYLKSYFAHIKTHIKTFK